MSTATADYGWSSAAAAELERQRALAQARGESQEWSRRLEALRVEVDAARKTYPAEDLPMPTHPSPPPRQDADLQGWQAHATAMRESYHRTREHLDEQVGAIRSRRMMARLSAGLVGEATRVSHRPDREAHRQVEPDRAATLTRILSRLSSSVSDDDRARIEALANRLLETRNRTRANLVELELREQVEKANGVAEAIAAESREAAELQARVHGLKVHNIGSLLRDLDSVERGASRLTDTLREAVQDAIQTDSRIHEQGRAASIAVRAVQELGYEVEEGFESLLVGEGVARFQKQGWGENYVEWRMPLEGQRAGFGVVRVEHEESNGPPTEAEMRIEAEFCRDFPTLVGAARKHGLDMRVVSQTRAGEVPMRTTSEGPFKRQGARSRKRRAPRPKEKGISP